MIHAYYIMAKHLRSAHLHNRFFQNMKSNMKPIFTILFNFRKIEKTKML